ncbi:integrase catalytic region [Streptomyces bingchenggensis BCW-1]|uniref:Integrase catalytic region n=1 Tax=Streptomyces bingchenggensis (strain BCW-1) TaxID=749414 RepID=D7CDG0_STRBB|nr:MULTISPECIES: integrase core domain-containing protein [Streptomyces]ADI13002.1 integrase catalytic region [Streptomyces bingchenggensis BCW-1]
MPLSIVTALVRNLIKVPAAVLRCRVAKDAEVLALRHENTVLRRQIARVRYEPADRIRLAILSRPVPREHWRHVFSVTPTTLLAWHRQHLAPKWTFSQHRRPGRPSTAPTVKQLILRLVKENSASGHRRIQGELARLGYQIAPSTVWEILHAARIDPAPQRSGRTWREFLTAPHHGILAGVTAHPTVPWTVQQARNLTMTLGCRMGSLRFLLRDRDSKYTNTFDAVFQADDMEILLSPPRAPKANAVCERAVGTLRREVLDRILIYDEAHAVKVLTEYIRHYNRHRPHQSRQQLPPDSTELPALAHVTDLKAHRIERRPVLGGLINEYRQVA